MKSYRKALYLLLCTTTLHAAQVVSDQQPIIPVQRYAESLFDERSPLERVFSQTERNR